MSDLVWLLVSVAVLSTVFGLAALVEEIRNRLYQRAIKQRLRRAGATGRYMAARRRAVR